MDLIEIDKDHKVTASRLGQNLLVVVPDPLRLVKEVKGQDSGEALMWFLMCIGRKGWDQIVVFDPTDKLL